MSERYGFYDEVYDDGIIPTLRTGDGKTEFFDVAFHDGLVGVAMSYGGGVGINVKRVHPENTTTTDVEAKFQIIFDNPSSIDSLIETLLRARCRLPDNTGITKGA